MKIEIWGVACYAIKNELLLILDIFSVINLIVTEKTQRRLEWIMISMATKIHNTESESQIGVVINKRKN